MPIYEYECKNCHHHFDLMQKITAPPVKQCPMCLQDTAVKLVSAAGFQLKGTGWYATDFKNPPTTETKKTDTAAENSKQASAEEKKPSAELKDTSISSTNSKKGETD